MRDYAGLYVGCGHLMGCEWTGTRMGVVWSGGMGMRSSEPQPELMLHQAFFKRSFVRS